MNYDEELDDKLDKLDKPLSPEREISLGTGTVLGIFFVLALVCAAFFGFGYSMGHRSAQNAASIAAPGTVAEKDPSDSPFSKFKAAPTTGRTPSAPAKAPPETTPADEVTDTPPPRSTTVEPSEPATTVQPTATKDGAWVVQVSATTRQPDAEALTKVLLSKGFTATIKQDPDQKFHVRVGPFASKKDADTTRKLLVASGYKDPFLAPR